MPITKFAPFNYWVKARRWVLVFFVRGIGGFAGVLATWIAARFLGAETAGLIFLALAIVTVLSTLTRLGLDNPVVRFVSVHASNNELAQAAGIFQIALKWVGMASLIMAVVLFTVADALAVRVFHAPALTPVLRIMALLLPLMSCFNLYGQGFIGLRRPEMATMLQNNCLSLGFIGLLLGGLALSLPWRGEVIAAIAYLGAGVLTVLFGQRLWQRGLPVPSNDVSAVLLWQSATPLWVAAVMTQAVAWSGQIASGIWLEASSVAHMAAAQRFAQLISLVLMVTNMIVAPRFAAFYQQGKTEDLKQLARRTTRIMALVATPIIMLLMALAAPLMQLFGKGFESAVPLVRILMLAQWINVVTGSVGYLLQMTGHERDMRNIAVLAGIFSIVFVAVLTAYYGVIGAAWGTAIAVSTQNIGALLMVRRRLGFYTIG